MATTHPRGDQTYLLGSCLVRERRRVRDGGTPRSLAIEYWKGDLLPLFGAPGLLLSLHLGQFPLGLLL